MRGSEGGGRGRGKGGIHVLSLLHVSAEVKEVVLSARFDRLLLQHVCARFQVTQVATDPVRYSRTLSGFVLVKRVQTLCVLWFLRDVNTQHTKTEVPPKNNQTQPDFCLNL